MKKPCYILKIIVKWNDTSTRQYQRPLRVPDIGKYNISAEKAFLQSVRECRAETVILFEHLKKALASLKEDAEAAGEGTNTTLLRRSI